MDVQLTTEQEAFLFQMARHEGKPVGQLLAECAASMLQEKTQRLAEVEEGWAAAEQGEFIEEHEMDARVATMLGR